MSTQIQIRRDTSANWLSADPVLAEGELGYDLTSEKFKVGDGSTPWSGLEYSSSSANPDWSDIQNKPSEFPPSAHNHDGVYQPVGDYLTDAAGSIANDGKQYARKDGAWTEVVAPPAGGGGDTVWEQNGSDIYYNDGNVGIGTDSPTAYSDFTGITIDGTAGSNLTLRRGGTVVGDISSERDQNILSITAPQADGKIEFHTAGYLNNAMTIGAGAILR